MATSFPWNLNRRSQCGSNIEYVIVFPKGEQNKVHSRINEVFLFVKHKND